MKLLCLCVIELFLTDSCQAQRLSTLKALIYGPNGPFSGSEALNRAELRLYHLSAPLLPFLEKLALHRSLPRVLLARV